MLSSVKNNSSTVSNLATADKTAWYTGIQYGVAQQAQVGTQDVYAKYFQRGANAVSCQAATNLLQPYFNTPYDVAGFSLGYDRTVAENLVLILEYDKYKGFSTSTNPTNIDYNPYYEASFTFWF